MIEEENYQEEYTIEDHNEHAPQVYNTNAHESSRFFMEEEHQPRSLRHRGQREVRGNHRNNQQYQQIQNEDIMVAEETWPAEKDDLLFVDVSAIHHVPKNKGNSLNNSYFENPFNEIKSHREEYGLNDSQNSLSLEIPNGQNKGIYTRPKSSRRGPVYNDSSDSDTDIRVGSQKARNPNAMEIVDGKQGGPADKRKYEDYKRRENRTALDETNYEPKIVKKQWVQETKTVNINGKPTLVQQEGIRVKEIYDYPYTSSNINKREKDLRAQYYKYGGEEPTKKKDASKRKASEDNQDFMNKSISLDTSYFEDAPKNSIKSHVAKKTVQEVAFRGKELMSDGDLKTIIGAKGPAPSLTAASTQAKSTGGLFGSGNATNTSATTAAATNTSTTTAATSGTESQKKGLFSNDTQDSTTKSSGLFAPKANTATTDAAKAEEKKNDAARSSLFGSDLSPATKPTVPTPSLTKAESTAPLATDENKGIPRVPTQTDLASQNTKPPGGGLFSSFNNSAATGSTLTAAPTENKEPAKSSLPNTGGLFGAASSSGQTATATEPKPAETKPAGSLFSNLGGGQSSNITPAATTENKPAPPAGGLFANSKPAETKQDGANKSSLFGGINQTTSLFGENPPATTPAAGNNNSSPVKPQTTTPSASSSSLFGGGSITGGNTATGGNASSSLFGDKGLTDNKPAPPPSSGGGSLFGNLAQNVTKPAENKGNLFGNLIPSNQETAASGEMKSETPAVSSGGLFANAQQNSNASAPKAGGMFANFNNSAAPASTGGNTGGGGLFGNMAGGSSGLFAKK